MLYDAIIIGGGPAGLSAALILGRCLRKVLIIDSRKPRNISAKEMHGYLTRDGIVPSEFYNIAHSQLQKYECISYREDEITHAKLVGHQFEVMNQEGQTFRAKKLLLALGVVDDLPKIPGFKRFYGKSIFHCPYCDAWEVRGIPLAVYGKGRRGYQIAFTLHHWSQDVILCTDGPAELSSEELQALQKRSILIREEKIQELYGEKDVLQEIRFEQGPPLKRKVLFFNTGSYIRSDLLEQLGCCFSQEEGVATGKYVVTNIPGLYAAGNVLREVQLVIVAAAEGAEAAFGIHTALLKEDLS
jgi:thioredoxin reductase